MVSIMNGYVDNKEDLLKRLSRAEGQVRGIARMIENDQYCIDILTQVSAATKALETVALSLLGDHLGGAAELEAYATGVEDVDEAAAGVARRQARLARARLN